MRIGTVWALALGLSVMGAVGCAPKTTVPIGTHDYPRTDAPAAEPVRALRPPGVGGLRRGPRNVAARVPAPGFWCGPIRVPSFPGSSRCSPESAAISMEIANQLALTRQ